MVKILMVSVQVLLTAASGASESQGWTSQDIGSVSVRGSATNDEKAMVWTVRGDGTDVYNESDSFHYVYQRFMGDGHIIAKVRSVEDSDPWAKAGLMIRESLDPGARCAFIYATPLNGISTQIRAETGGWTTSDNWNRSMEQMVLTAPVWIKLERKGELFRAYYASDEPDRVWKPVAWKPKAVTMSQAVYLGLAVTSHRAGVLCEAQFSGVTIHSALEGEITDIEILESPKQARRKAYRNLERLGNWRKDVKGMRKHGRLIANSLFALARTAELGDESTHQALPNYHRIAELFPDSPSAVDALIRITVLSGKKGLQYSVKHLERRPNEDRGRFYLGVVKGYSTAAKAREWEPGIQSFVEYVDATSNLRLLERAVGALRESEYAPSICRSLIQHGMAQSSDERIAVTGLRYMALKLREDQIQALAEWAAAQFEETQLAACAKALTADMYYDREQYVDAVQMFYPGLFQKGLSESRIVAEMETAMASYRRNTLQHTMMDLECIYKALAQKADSLGYHVVAVHCYRKIVEVRGLSLNDFERSALKRIKHSERIPESEVWFWKGLIAADEGDLGMAVVAYERFLQGDSQSVLAAKAYYDIARTKMAIGEDATEWIAKAKALSPCDVVIQLERRLNAASSRGQG